MKMVDIDWDDFLEDDGLSLEEERDTSVAVSEYLAKQETIESNKNIEDILSGKRIEILNVNISSLPKKLNRSPLLNKDEMIELLNNKDFIDVNPIIYFPKIKSIGFVFSFLKKISTRLSENTVFQFRYGEYKESEIKLVNTLIYLGFLEVRNNSYESFYIPTNTLFELKQVEDSKKIIYFVSQLVRHKTIKESMMLQIYSSNFDSIAKEILLKNLSENLSVLNENLDSKEIKELMYNMRRWYMCFARHSYTILQRKSTHLCA
ncbi:hypothetical protein [Jeotgalibaca caeni]|uniref:hypothetical protein n=1 Tax=Jeotgalibaca caeni TaxID=3028623 RepID=UPI00237D39DF|nr:hypothetical protein [Jeotgalibaca caeni]MDE1550019.1 hypothetical protein [Jeotgalibaca caeni]